MLLEVLALGLLVPTEKETANQKYALLLEEAEKVDWSIVRFDVRNLKTFFLTTKVYKITVSQRDYVISTSDGDRFLYGLLKGGFIETAKALLLEAKIK